MEDKESQLVYALWKKWKDTGDYAFLLKEILLTRNYTVDRCRKNRLDYAADMEYRYDLESIFFNSANNFAMVGSGADEHLFGNVLSQAGMKVQYVDSNAALVKQLADDASYYAICLTLDNHKILQQAGISEDKIIRMQATDKLQYFDHDIVNLYSPRKHVFIDGGAVDLTSSMLFLEACNGNCERIYAFEPDNTAYEYGVNSLQINGLANKVQLIKKGLFSKDDTLFFVPSEVASIGSSYIMDTHNESSVSIEVTSIDNVLGGKRCTFIKLDVEGAEMEALKGAEKTIVKYKPTLAVCVYHKPEDLDTIPAYIHWLVPEYKFYLRHYQVNHAECVLYAVLEENCY